MKNSGTSGSSGVGFDLVRFQAWVIDYIATGPVGQHTLRSTRVLPVTESERYSCSLLCCLSLGITIERCAIVYRLPCSPSLSPKGVKFLKSKYLATTTPVPGSLSGIRWRSDLREGAEGCVTHRDVTQTFSAQFVLLRGRTVEPLLHVLSNLHEGLTN